MTSYPFRFIIRSGSDNTAPDGLRYEYKGKCGVLKVSRGVLMFKCWKALVEQQIGKLVKLLRTDNGLEFCSDEFNIFYSKGSSREGVLAEACNTVANLINRSPSTAIECMTPNEKWKRLLANYLDLKVLGCMAYAHVRERKLDPRTKKCIFLSYAMG
ncbi:hypothetical protein CRG98_008358 [Punica granatum]|uniref:Retroviral polymerase SH3-like domain-containing protein n=1 Tax=Punica granatum TaxID=22663 RepID=A0A2I0KRZ6_PUNGR|nr:hypothetical protein CRG98_008358 [Punica granatum]